MIRLRFNIQVSYKSIEISLAFSQSLVCKQKKSIPERQWQSGIVICLQWPELYTGKVFAGAGINLDGITFFDKVRHLD